MVNSFKQFLISENREVYFTFGRMNPPTIGHGKLLDKLAEMAGKNPYRVYLSHSQDRKNNPLLFEDKIKTARKFFPRHGRSILNKEDVNNILEAASALYEEGFKNVTLVVGADRVNEFDILLNKYNGHTGRHGFYVFENINVASAGHRDPDAAGAEGSSATKLREAAINSDFVTFSQGIPKNVSNVDAKKLYNDVRIGLGLSEEKTFKKYVQVKPVSDIRERYVQGDLFNVGDDVIIKKTAEVARLVVLGSNYVIVENNDGKRVRKWINDVEKTKNKGIK